MFKETAVTTTSDQETEGQSNVLMLSAHQKIVEELKKVMPTAVDQVSSFVSELRRITLLWDELWLGTLAQYSGEVQRRINRCLEGTVINFELYYFGTVINFEPFKHLTEKQ